MIVALDWRFVVYPGLASVDEGAGVEDVIHEVPLLHRPLLHRHLHSMRGSQPVKKTTGVDDIQEVPLLHRPLLHRQPV